MGARPDKDRTPEQREHIALLKKDFRAFVEAAWPLIDPTPFTPNWHVDAVCEALQFLHDGEYRRLLINIPPGFAKSILGIVLFPAYEWTTMPHERYLSTSHSANIPARDGRRMMRLVESDWYQQHFGDVVQPDKEKWGETRFQNMQQGYRIATSVGSGTTGERGTTVIFDDPHDILHLHHPAKITASINHHGNVLQSRGVGKESRELVIGQRVAYRDLSHKIMELEDAGGAPYEKLILPMRYDPNFLIRVGDRRIGPDKRDVRHREFLKIEREQGREEAVRRVAGQVLFPEMYPPETVEHLFLSTTGDAQANYNQNPSEEASQKFARSHFRYFWIERDGPTEHWLLDGDSPRVVEPYEVQRVLTVDLATSTDPSADYFCCQAWGITEQTDMLFLDEEHGRFEGPDQIPILWAMVKKWRPHVILIEKNGYQLSYVQEAIREGLPVQPVDSREKLIFRSVTLAKRYEAHKVFHLGGHHGFVGRYEEELLEFPSTDYHDDRVSAASQVARALALGDLVAVQIGPPSGPIAARSIGPFGGPAPAPPTAARKPAAVQGRPFDPNQLPHHLDPAHQGQGFTRPF